MRKQSELKTALGDLMSGVDTTPASNPIVENLQKVAAALRNTHLSDVSYEDLNRVKAALYDKR